MAKQEDAMNMDFNDKVKNVWWNKLCWNSLKMKKTNYFERKNGDKKLKK